MGKKTKMTYLKTLHLKIQRGRDDIIQVWIDPIFIMVPWGLRRTKVDCTHIAPFTNNRGLNFCQDRGQLTTRNQVQIFSVRKRNDASKVRLTAHLAHRFITKLAKFNPIQWGGGGHYAASKRFAVGR